MDLHLSGRRTSCARSPSGSSHYYLYLFTRRILEDREKRTGNKRESKGEDIEEERDFLSPHVVSLLSVWFSYAFHKKDSFSLSQSFILIFPALSCFPFLVFRLLLLSLFYFIFLSFSTFGWLFFLSSRTVQCYLSLPLSHSSFPVLSFSPCPSRRRNFWLFWLCFLSFAYREGKETTTKKE